MRVTVGLRLASYSPSSSLVGAPQGLKASCRRDTIVMHRVLVGRLIDSSILRLSLGDHFLIWNCPWRYLIILWWAVELRKHIGSVKTFRSSSGARVYLHILKCFQKDNGIEQGLANRNSSQGQSSLPPVLYIQFHWNHNHDNLPIFLSHYKGIAE